MNKDNIIEMYINGNTITDIAKEHKTNRKKIRKILKESGHYVKNPNYGKKYNWSKEDISNIIDMYVLDNMSSEAIGKVYGCWDTTILNVLNKEGINTKRARENHNWSKYKVKEDYFDKIDSENKAYWFGFLLADGHVSKNGAVMLTLQSRDVGHICKFRSAISSNHPIKEIKKSSSHSIHIGSAKMARSLREKGLNNNKSIWFDVEKVVSSVPKKLEHHFIRGYFDGDGSVGIYSQTHYDKNLYNFSITGIRNFIKYLKSALSIETSIIKDSRGGGSFYLKTSGRSDLERIYYFLYDGASIYMDRKHDILEEIANIV